MNFYIDLIHGMLEPDPAIRLTLTDIKKHPWMTEGNTKLHLKSYLLKLL